MGQYQHVLHWYWPSVSVTSSRSWAEIISKRSKVTQTLELMELKPNLTRLDAERVYSSVSRKKCQQSKKLRQVSQLYAPVITFISGCGESDGGVTDQKAAFWHLQVWLQQTFLCLPRQKKTIFLAGSQGISSCVCLRNKHFFFCFWTLPAKTGILGRPAVLEPEREQSAVRRGTENWD